MVDRGGRVAPARRAHRGAVPRVPARARSGVLGVRVSGDHDLRARHRVSLARRRAGDRRRGRAGRRRPSCARRSKHAGGFTVRDDRRRRTSIARCATAGRRSSSCRARRRRIASTQARAESQVARLAVDAALQRAAGRGDAFSAREQPIDAVGSRYIDWLVPGLLGMNIMGTGLWGVGFSIVKARTRKLLKRLVATPMSRAHYLAVARAQPPGCSSRSKSIGDRRLRLDGVRCRGARRRAGAGARWRCSARSLRRSRPARGEPRAHDRSGVGADEPGDAADVGAVGRVLRLEQLPGGDAAVHPGAAAHGAQRRAAWR